MKYIEDNDDFKRCHDDKNSDMSVCAQHESCYDCPYYYADYEG